MYLRSITVARGFDIKSYKYRMYINIIGCKDEFASREDGGIVKVNEGTLTQIHQLLPDPCTKEQLADTLTLLAERVHEMEW